MALHFTATGSPPSAKRTRILPMMQHAGNIWNEGKFSPLFTDHRRCWKCCPSTRRHSSHRRKRVWFKLWSCVASHVRWVPCHHGMARPQVADGGDSLQFWRVAANMFWFTIWRWSAISLRMFSFSSSVRGLLLQTLSF
jgi:hypothetical protein